MIVLVFTVFVISMSVLVMYQKERVALRRMLARGRCGLPGIPNPGYKTEFKDKQEGSDLSPALYSKDPFDSQLVSLAKILIEKRKQIIDSKDRVNNAESIIRNLHVSSLGIRRQYQSIMDDLKEEIQSAEGECFDLNSTITKVNMLKSKFFSDGADECDGGIMLPDRPQTCGSQEGWKPQPKQRRRSSCISILTETCGLSEPEPPCRPCQPKPACGQPEEEPPCRPCQPRPSYRQSQQDQSCRPPQQESACRQSQQNNSCRSSQEEMSRRSSQQETSCRSSQQDMWSRSSQQEPAYRASRQQSCTTQNLGCHPPYTKPPELGNITCKCPESLGPLSTCRPPLPDCGNKQSHSMLDIGLGYQQMPSCPPPMNTSQNYPPSTGFSVSSLHSSSNASRRASNSYRYDDASTGNRNSCPCPPPLPSLAPQLPPSQTCSRTSQASSQKTSRCPCPTPPPRPTSACSNASSSRPRPTSACSSATVSSSGSNVPRTCLGACDPPPKFVKRPPYSSFLGERLQPAPLSRRSIKQTVFTECIEGEEDETGSWLEPTVVTEVRTSSVTFPPNCCKSVYEDFMHGFNQQQQAPLSARLPVIIDECDPCAEVPRDISPFEDTENVTHSCGTQTIPGEGNTDVKICRKEP